jgi:hypothetical protein
MKLLFFLRLQIITKGMCTPVSMFIYRYQVELCKIY